VRESVGYGPEGRSRKGATRTILVDDASPWLN
jgi:hypothetical protein